ncbi:UV damage endonuclease UvsE [Capsulimonas corticalis]|uniref:UV damage endonuclease UvsE n=1 Tax=Capsulimonas corticalis TaxID=2219043 RepID=A0A402CTJ2_9BACT|nr:UV DNA damage repair endonuclease UvsE [Capsulimonas corticalis]BDI30711.1 UV damage endonuclease UvsE [Capsulimonas corticalis]
MRLGFAVKVLGAGGNQTTVDPVSVLKSNDARRWQSEPHVRQSIEYVAEIFHYLYKSDIHMYRMSSDFAPYLTHPDLPQFHHQLTEAASELAELGALARKYDIRLSLHPSQYILLNALDEEVARKSILDLNAQAQILDSMGCGPEAVVVTHVGGVYGEREESLKRFISRYKNLPEATKRRLVVENDDVSFSHSETMKIHEATGCPVIFDNLHHFCLNPEGVSMRDALTAALGTWPESVIPKIHYSSPSTSFDVVETKETGNTGRAKTVQKWKVPPTKAHSDFIDPMEFALFWEAVEGDKRRSFDMMLEAKAKDVALLKLRRDIARQIEFGAMRPIPGF